MKRAKIIIPLLIAVLLAGCGAKSSNGSTADSTSSDYEEAKQEIAYDGEGTAPMDANAESTSINFENLSEKKIIDNANLSIETVEFDKAVDTLKTSLEQCDGYMQSSNINHPGVGSNNYKTYRNADFVVRVPKESFQDFLRSAETMGVITNANSSSEDITKQYYDTETRLKVYEAQEARYLELLNEAKTMEDILTIEKQLTEVRYNIEYLTGYKNQMNDLVDYGTINISLYEVDEPTKLVDNPKNFGDKIVNAFATSLKSLKYVGTSLILIIVSIIPYAVILSIIGWIIFYVYKKTNKNKFKK